MANDTSELLKLEPFNEGRLMEGIFTYQKNLIGKYIENKMLPQYPINLQAKGDQKFIRETMGWAIEELAEAGEKFDELMAIFIQEVYTEAEVQKKIVNKTPALTEELMDAMHFMIELLYYSGIEADDMLGYYSSRLRQENYHQAFMTEDALATSMMYARHININNDEARIAMFNAFKFETFPEEGYAKALSIKLPAQTIYAGTKLGWELMVVIERVCWDITKNLYKAKNRLKNRDWHKEERETNIQAYQEDLMISWVSFTVLLDLFQLTDQAIYYHYEAKNWINQQRLIDNY